MASTTDKEVAQKVVDYYTQKNSNTQPVADATVATDLAAQAAPAVIEQPVPQVQTVDVGALAPQVVTPEQSQALINDMGAMERAQYNYQMDTLAGKAPQGGLDQAVLGLPQTAAEAVVNTDLIPEEAPIKQYASNYLKAATPAPAPASQGPLISDQELEAAASPMAQATAAVPTQAEIDAEFEKRFGAVRKLTAEKSAMDNIDELQKISDARMKAEEQAVDEQIKNLDAQVQQRSFAEIMSQGTFGQKFGAALAIMMGGASQGLTGAKSNPVMDFFDKVADQQASKNKLTLEQKEMLKQQLYQAGQVELQKMENATNNAYRKDQLRLERQKLAAEQEAAYAKLRAEFSSQVNNSSIYSGRELTPEDVAAMKVDERKGIISLPTGKAVMLRNPNDATPLGITLADTSKGLDTIARLKQLTSGKDFSKFSLNDRAAMEPMRLALVGLLRLPFLGPGVMTPEERKLLEGVVGNPSSFYKLKSVELLKLDALSDQLKASATTEARTKGVKVDVFPERMYKYNKDGEERAIREEELLKLYKQKLPNVSSDKILMAIQKQYPRL